MGTISKHTEGTLTSVVDLERYSFDLVCESSNSSLANRWIGEVSWKQSSFEEARANAKRIVEAWNTFDESRELLTIMLEDYRGLDSQNRLTEEGKRNYERLLNLLTK